MKSRYLEIAAVLGALLALPATAGAATGSETVTNFAQVITLKASGQLVVDQQIDYDFGGTPAHDITMGLPTSYHDDQGRDYRMAFTLASTTADGVAMRFASTVTPQVARIILPGGDPGHHARHFALHYTLAPSVLVGDQADLLRFTATGLAWAVPIARASVELHSPVPATNLTCFTGTPSVNTSTCESFGSGAVTTVATDAPLPPGSALTIFGSFPHGSFTSYLAPYQPSNSWVGLAVDVAVIIIVMAGIVLTVILALRRRAIVRTSQAEYTNHNDTP